nr:MAG TPA: hypothetical protein [Caudoviricetes sp.]
MAWHFIISFYYIVLFFRELKKKDVYLIQILL